MPWILTVSPRSIAAGGVEVTERATGERAVRSIEDVDGVPRGPGGDAGLTGGRDGAEPMAGALRPRGRPVRPARGRRSTPRPRPSSSPGGPCSSAPPGRRGRRRRRPRAREADQRRPRLAERPVPSAPATTASASGSARSRASAGGPASGTAGRRAPGRRQPAPRPAPPRGRGGPTRPDLVRGEPAERMARFLDRVSRLSPDELDRLAAAEPPPIAFLATVRRFVTPDAAAAFEAAEAELAARVPRERWAEVGLREGLLGVAAELVLSRVLRRHARGAVPRPRARPAAARVGGVDRPAALRPQRRRGARRPCAGPPP